MSLRRRLALLSAAAVAVTVVLASAIVYVLVRSNLRSNIDEDLRQQADRASARVGEFNQQVPPPDGGPQTQELPAGAVPALPPPVPGGPSSLGQVIRADGQVIQTPGTTVQIPVSAQDDDLAANGGEPHFEDVELGSGSLRVLTQPLPDGGAIQVATSLQDTEDTLSTLVLVLFLVSAGGIALAAARADQEQDQDQG